MATNLEKMESKTEKKTTLHDMIASKSFAELSKEPFTGEQYESDEKFLNPSEYEERLAMDTYKRFARVKEAKTRVGDIGDIEEMWNLAEKNVVGFIPGEVEEDSFDEEEKTRLFIPLTHATIDTILSEWIRQHSTGRVGPSEDEADEPKAEILDMIVRYVERKNNIYKIDLDANYNMLTYGNKIQKIYFKKTYRKLRKAIGVDPKNGFIQYKNVIEDDGGEITIENVDVRNIFPDDMAREPDFSDAGDTIEQKVVDFSTFQTQYGYLPNAKFVKAIGKIEENEVFDKPKNLDANDVQVLMWYNKREDFLRIVANGIVLDDSPLPDDHKDLPYCGAGDIKRPGNFWWIGEPELIRYPQDEINIHRGIRGDVAKLGAAGMIFAPASGRLEDEEIIVKPGKIYYFQGVIPPTPINITSNIAASAQEEERMKDDITTATGVDRRPEATSPDEVATSVIAKREATLKRIAKKIFHSQVQMENRRGWLILNLIMQYYKLPRLTEIVGEKAIEEYKKDLDNYVVDEENVNEETGAVEPKVYEKKYRRISVPNKEVVVNPKLNKLGKMESFKLNVREKDGYTFFDATPKLLSGKFDYIINPDIDLPVTKAQEIEIINMLYDKLATNPIINSTDGKMHIAGPNGEDIVKPIPKGVAKLTELLLKKHGYNIADFTPDETAQDDPMMEQAMKENVAMMQGMALGPTPLASPNHTIMHNKFLEANTDESTDPAIREIFNNHIIGETQFQEEIANKMSSKVGGANATNAPGSTGQAAG